MAYDGVDEEILQDFIVEASELIETLNEQLVQLEESPEDHDLLNAIFRGFHTVLSLFNRELCRPHVGVVGPCGLDKFLQQRIRENGTPIHGAHGKGVLWIHHIAHHVATDGGVGLIFPI